MADEVVKLTKKQQLFVAHYLQCLNATEAAKKAGYPAKSAYAIGAENLRKPQIKALIDREFELRIMSATEVLTRLSDIARGDVGEILEADDEFGLKVARGKGLTRLIKTIKRRDFTDKDGNTTTTYEFELYNADNALVNLAKYHSLFTTKIEISDLRDKSDSELVREFARLVQPSPTQESGSDPNRTQAAGGSATDSN